MSEIHVDTHNYLSAFAMHSVPIIKWHLNTITVVIRMFTVS